MNNNLSLNDCLQTHCNVSMEHALAAERYPIWQRACPEMSDIDFIRLGLFHCISPVDSVATLYKQVKKFMENTCLTRPTLKPLNLQDALACLKPSNAKAIKFSVIN